jgi:hypothetical protein
MTVLSNRLTVGLAGSCVCAALLGVTLVVHADTEKTAADYARNTVAMLEAYRHVESGVGLGRRGAIPRLEALHVATTCGRSFLRSLPGLRLR